ncbi:MAG: sodium/solute symporter [Ignavibacteriaceae bacterium]|nr:sodium/solute symporter [Ignavibacteriaceae bacterium]
MGKVMGGKQSSIKDYFLGAEKVPWLAVCFAIVAAETSTLTFISIPGLAYLTNLNFLQVTLGYLIGRIVISFVLLPLYFKGDLETAYSFLESRFGKKTRSVASSTFIFTRLAADGVRLFATAIPIKLMLDVSYPVAILIIAVVTLFYTYSGGIKGVIWVDALQMVIYLGGAFIALVLLMEMIPGGVNSVFTNPELASKLQIFNLNFGENLGSFFSQPYSLIGGILGGAFLSMASHGVDQLVVQRLLATGKLNSARKALITSGVIVIFQFALFLFIGVLLFAYYGKLDIKSDEIFPMFILQEMPVIPAGIIIAGLLAAAMSTLAGSISSITSATVYDLLIPNYKKELTDEKKLNLSKIFTLIWAGVLTLSAIAFMNSSKVVVELALSIASFTYGALLGTFFLGIIVKRAEQKAAITGFFAGIVFMTLIITFKLVAWTWFTLIGVIFTVLVGAIVTKLTKNK